MSINTLDEFDEEITISWTESDNTDRYGCKSERTVQERIRDERVRSARNKVFDIVRSSQCGGAFKREFMALFGRGMKQGFHGGRDHTIEHDVAALAFHTAMVILDNPKVSAGANEQRLMEELKNLYQQHGGVLPNLSISPQNLRLCFEALGKDSDCEKAFQFIVRDGCGQFQILLPNMLSAGAIKEGRSSEIFLIACFYDVAEQAPRWFSEMDDRQKKMLGLEFDEWPLRSRRINEWCKVMDISRKAFLDARSRIYSARSNPYPVRQQNRDMFFKPTSQSQHRIGLGGLTDDEKKVLSRR